MMKKSEFAILCLRFMGIYCFINGLAFIPIFIGDFITPVESRWSFFVAPLLQLIIGAILFYQAPRFVHLIVDCRDESDDPIRWEASAAAARAALLILGFYLIANAIPHFFQILVNTAAYQQDISTVPKHLRQIQQHWRYLAEPGLKILIALWFILGNKGILRAVERFDGAVKK
ncbi:MAG: hypothetical protein GY859_01435 [Desulfobacterales bacterium]|nr:hypothetical protein [Desulfobacterales bacterium]